VNDVDATTILALVGIIVTIACTFWTHRELQRKWQVLLRWLRAQPG
jgi:hypothetical protein